MKTLSLLFIGLLISGMSFSKTTEKKGSSHVTIENQRTGNVTDAYAPLLSPFSTEIDQERINNKISAFNLYGIKSGNTTYKAIAKTRFPADSFTNYDAFITKITHLTSSADSSSQLNTFWNDLIATGNFPFALGTKVAFLYRGTASSISWAGMFNNWDMNADKGHRLGISDIWILEKEFPKDTRCEYKIVKNGSEWLADPHNPNPLVGDYGNSELWMPDYSKHTELIPRTGISKGTLSANILINSSHLGYSCQYRVYTPAGYGNLSSLPTIYVTDGQNYLDNNMGKMITVLDNLIADKTIQPIIAIFLDPRDPNNLSNDRRGNEYRNNQHFADYITKELIPVIDANYKTSNSADARAIMGASYGGYNAAYFSVAAKDYFHNIGINSAYLHPNGNYNIDSELQAAHLDNMKLYLSYGTFDANGERYFNRLKNIFDAKGKAYDYTIVGDGHTWQNWSRVIGDALEYFIPNNEIITTVVGPLIQNRWTTFTWPYNAYLPEDADGINGHVGNACGYTSIARILQYWGFPSNGNGHLQFTDVFGHYWNCDLSNMNLDYLKMPNELARNATQNEYDETAKLFLAASSVGEKIKVWATGKEVNLPGAFVDYFNFSSTARIINREDYTRQEWIDIFKNELDNGRPMVIVGRTTDSPAPGEPGRITGHWWICDGYNSDDKFYSDYAFGGIKGFDDIDSLGGVYIAYNRAVIGLEPDYKGKNIDLISPNVNETFSSNSKINIRWSSTNVSNIRIEYTINNGQDWKIISDSLPASTASYLWTTPNISTDECRIKLTDISNNNIYDYSDHVFSIKLYEITLKSPNGGEYYISGGSGLISWESTPVSDIKIEYSSDNGSKWNLITSSTPASLGTYDWIIPDIRSGQCKIRITDISNASVLDESNTFEIGLPNNAGGPYAVDDNTVLLLHFENNLRNSSPLSEDGSYHGNEISYNSNFKSTLGHYLKLDGNSYVSVPHNSNLSLTGDWTIEAWVYFNSFGSGSSTNPTIVSKSNSKTSNYLVWYHNGWGSIKGQFTSTTSKDVYLSIGNNAITSGKWYHIAYIRDNTRNTHLLIIRDKSWNIIAQKEYNYGETVSTPVINSEDVLIGKLFGTNNFFFDGYLDELRISNVVRSFENTTGVSETSFGRLISIYPNPAGKVVYISSPEIVELAIFSLTGQKIIERKGFSKGNVDLSTFKKGIYVIRFSGRKGVVSRKLIVE